MPDQYTYPIPEPISQSTRHAHDPRIGGCGVRFLNTWWPSQSRFRWVGGRKWDSWSQKRKIRIKNAKEGNKTKKSSNCKLRVHRTQNTAIKGQAKTHNIHRLLVKAHHLLRDITPTQRVTFMPKFTEMIRSEYNMIYARRVRNSLESRPSLSRSAGCIASPARGRKGLATLARFSCRGGRTRLTFG